MVSWKDFLSKRIGFQPASPANKTGVCRSSNASGAIFTTDERTQLFVTTGLFRRVDWGLQGGLVVDYLHDDWYYSADLTQLRGELSWVTESGADLGFMFSSGIGDDRTSVTTQTAGAAPVTGLETFSVTNLNAFFYRTNYCNGAQSRLFAGFTGDSDGLIGADASLPFTESCGIRGSMTYLIPQEGRVDGGPIEESWNLGVTFTWRPGCASACGRDYYRPLFNVADNGSMMVDRR